MIGSNTNTNAFEIERYHKEVNEVRVAELMEAINNLRQMLNTFRNHDFIDLPATLRYTVSYKYRKNGPYCDPIPYPYIRLSGAWLKYRGFDIEDKFRILSLDGILILFPENHSAEMEENVSVLTFGKIAV